MYQLYLMNIYSADRRSNKGGNGIGRGGVGGGGYILLSQSLLLLILAAA